MSLIARCAWPLAAFLVWVPANGEAAGTPPGNGEQARAGEFAFEDVVRLAEQRAGRAYEPDRPELPEALADLNYDEYRDIRFRPDRTFWRERGLPFHLQFFSRGFLFVDRVTINIIDETGVRPVSFSSDLFDYGKNKVPAQLPPDIGFAGFRLFYPLNSAGRHDEVAAFLGASYFRAVGAGQNYGVSVRGLAIDTGIATPEEFPVFREFWIRKPGKDDTSITVFGLLDSPRATGAFRFIIRPGADTVIEVHCRLFMRDRVGKLGIAPLTSMFHHGELTTRYVDDFRPEVHDSDGLLAVAGDGERIWRPVVNPKRLQITQLSTVNPRGFGLLQRDRHFDNYQDTEARYHIRPSVWVEPRGDWGKGSVELVEIPSPNERNDNIVAFWTPEQRTHPKQVLDFEYALHFTMNPEEGLQGARAIATRVGAGGSDAPDHSRRKFVIDFTGPSLSRQDPRDADVEGVCNASSGRITQAVAHHNPYVDGWRLFFEWIPDQGASADLRCFLRRGKNVLTETWTYRWAPG